MANDVKKKCYYCHLEKDKSEMQQIVVWFCNTCSEKSTPKSKKASKSE